MHIRRGGDGKKGGRVEGFDHYRRPKRQDLDAVDEKGDASWKLRKKRKHGRGGRDPSDLQREKTFPICNPSKKGGVKKMR